MLPVVVGLLAWRPGTFAPVAGRHVASRTTCARMEQDEAAWAQLAIELERAVAVTKDLASSSNAPPPSSPEAALDALRLAAGQRMEDRIGEQPGARDGFGGFKRLVSSLTESLVEAKARLSDMSTRLEAADATAATATARAEAAEAAEAATAAELRQNVRVLAATRAELREGQREAAQAVGELDDALERTQDRLRSTEDAMRMAEAEVVAAQKARAAASRRAPLVREARARCLQGASARGLCP